jgi:hypothetical protein
MGLLVPAARCFGDAAVHGEVLQLQADDQVVGVQRDRVYALPDTGFRPGPQPASDGAVRATGGGDPLVPRPCTSASTTCSNTTRAGTRRRWQPSGWVESNSGGSSPIAAWNSTQIGTSRQDGTAGTSPPVITERRELHDHRDSCLHYVLTRQACDPTYLLPVALSHGPGGTTAVSTRVAARRRCPVRAPASRRLRHA